MSMLMLGTALNACSDDNKEMPNLPDNNGSGPTIDPVERVAYILNEGMWNANNAGIAMFYPTQKGLADANYYATMNGGKTLGDVANGMVEEDDNIYVVLNGSKYAARLDASTKEQARYNFPATEGEPRCIEVEDDYVYVTQYGGQVSKLNTKDMTLAGTFKGEGNLEGIAEKDGKLYVAKSYTADGSGKYTYHNEVLVIDARTMTQTATIQVVQNPTKIYEIDDRIYVISQGNYEDVKGALQVIDTNEQKATTIAEDVAKITEGNNGLVYGVRMVYDANWTPKNTFFSYNPSTGTLSEKPFVQEAPAEFSSTAIYLLQMDEETGDIYIGLSDYQNTGSIYRFDKNGAPVDEFDSGGINPSTMLFLDKK